MMITRMQSCRRRKPLFALLPLLIVAACTLAACGNGGGDRTLLSARTATELRGTLDGVEQKVNAGDCEGAATQAQALGREAESLPRRVDSKLKAALLASASRLQDLISSKCEAAAPTGPTGASGTTGAQQQPQQEQKPGKAKKPKKAKKHEQKPGEVTPPDQLPPGQGGGTPNNGTDNGGSGVDQQPGGVTP
jgi:hypothetical protein